jgi:hypothetical protein
MKWSYFFKYREIININSQVCDVTYLDILLLKKLLTFERSRVVARDDEFFDEDDFRRRIGEKKTTDSF